MSTASAQLSLSYPRTQVPKVSVAQAVRDRLPPGLGRLRFPEEMETRFREDYFDKSAWIMRSSLLLGVVLYSAFGLLDRLATPSSTTAIWLVRFAVVVPGMMLTLLLSFRPWFRRVSQVVLAALVLLVGYGIIAMIAVVEERELGFRLYYAGLMLVIMWAYTFIRLRFIHAVAVCGLIVLGYEVVAIFHQQMLTTPENLACFVSNNFFFLSANLIGMTSCYFLERYARHDFEQRLQLERERNRSEELLCNILPHEVAASLKESPTIVAAHYDSASILFADIVDFSLLARRLEPIEVVQLLNEVFSLMDGFAESHGLEKIKTIGDCHMVAAGVPRAHRDHAVGLTRMALDVLGAVSARTFAGGRPITLRIGLNAGPVAAGVIGRRKFTYDVWGDTVNLVSRMQSQGTPNAVQITRAMYELIRHRFVCEPRGTVGIKGCGEVEVWHVLRERD